MLIKKYFLIATNFLILLSLIILFSSDLYAARKVAKINDHIKTFLYSDSQVYELKTAYGYQSNIEFSDDEEILTISMGNPVAFRVTPSNNRLFVKALQVNVKTNLTVITNLHSYQFDIVSTNKISDDVIYVMRFFYPLISSKKNIINSQVTGSFLPTMPRNNQNIKGKFQANKPFVGRPNMQRPSSPPYNSNIPLNFNRPSNFNHLNSNIIHSNSSPISSAIKNTNYSISGDQFISPVKIFDNGSQTFFKFGQNTTFPTFHMINELGVEVPVIAQNQGGYLVVNGVYDKMAIRAGAGLVCVFNEAM